MEKRTILAIALSLLLVSAWSAIVSRMYPVANKEVITKSPVIAESTPKVKPVVIQEYPPSARLRMDTDKQDIVFLESEAAVHEIGFPDYQNYSFPLYNAFLIEGAPPFGRPEIAQSRAYFIHTGDELMISKEFIILNNYGLQLTVTINNMSNLPFVFDYPILLGELHFDGKQHEAYQDVTVITAEKTHRPNSRKDILLQQAKILGIRDRYFCAIIEPDKGEYSAFIRKVTNKISRIGLHPVDITVPAGGSRTLLFHIYLGPQDLKIINHIQPEWAGIVHYGMFGIISEVLLWILGLFYRIFSNWGWAIIALSSMIYFILYPLSIKQIRAMKDMQALKPLVDDLNKKYKDNPQRLNKEVMQLYREHKVNPLGGCLPLLLQMPIFFALYQAIMRSIALKGAHFLWIKDLSEPDRLFILPQSLPFLGNEFNILPILMAIGMFVQQKVSMKATTGGSAEQQKIMMIMMPIIFGVVFYRMPSALVLYWFINSSLMLIFQIRASRTR